MIKKFLLFATLLISQNLIICADECSVFSCSQLSSETGQRCAYTSTSQVCESYYTSCEGLSNADCESVLVDLPPTQKCKWNASAQGGAKCELKQLECSDYTSTAPPVPCESLKASSNNYCITVNFFCAEESGCPTDSETCTTHKPLDSDHKWDHLKICSTTTNNGCESKLKLCTDFENNGDDCTKLSTSDNAKKKCFLGTGNSCSEKCVVCDCYTGQNSNDCEAISDYIEDKNIYKCVFQNTCQKKRKECSDFNDINSCSNYTPEDSTKRCVYTTIGSETKCYELPKKCSDLNTLTNIKDENHCKAIIEDLYSECAWESNSCVRKENKCELATHNSADKCDNILIDNAHKCKFIDGSCVKVDYYDNCNLYTGNDGTICEKIIITPESNKRCILQNDKQCVSVPNECESYLGTSEYECINNYKPLDENYKCVFRGGKCEKELKYQKEYCYQGDSLTCATIIPKNNGENYSIKCEMKDSICVRVEKTCSDYTGSDSEKCSSIIPKDQNKKCILRNYKCEEEYKTCKAYNDDTSVDSIVQTTCESIISNDGKKCKFTAGQSGSRATCASDITNKCDNTFVSSAVTLSSACASIKLSDISKKCYFSANGECLSQSKKCLELVFNGNEEGIENMCKSAETSANGKKCIISSDKKRCLEEDSSLIIEDEPSGPGGNGNTNDSTNENGSNQPEGTDESKPDSGKTIYLNSLIAMILFLLL